MKYKYERCSWCHKMGCNVRLQVGQNDYYTEYEYFCSKSHYKNDCKLMIKGGCELI